MTTNILADLNVASRMALPRGSTMPHGHQFVWITEDVTGRVCVGGVGYKQNMIEAHPDAEIRVQKDFSCRCCGK